MTAAARAPFRNAATARLPSNRLSTMAMVEGLGHTRNLTNCRPMPCSSTAIRKRAAPTRLGRTSRSQRSNSPPGTTHAPSARNFDSIDRSLSLVPRHCSLQIRKVRVAGNAGTKGPRRRHSVSPQLSRPYRRAAGWRRCRRATRQRRPIRESPDRDSSSILIWAAFRQDWKAGIPAATTSRGSASSRGLQSSPTAVSAARPGTNKYHSGIKGSAESVLCAGW